MKSAVVVLLAAFTAACVSTNAAVMNERLVRPAISADSVVIYRGEDQVPRKYDEIAILNSKASAEWTDEAKMFKSMRQKAANLGANGIVLHDMKDPGTGAKVAHALLGTSANRKGQAIAIYVHAPGADSAATAGH